MLFRIHDAITRAGFIVGAGCLLLVCALYNMEVVVRYILNSPTKWSTDLISYLLCGMIACVIPELTRRNSHIVISVLIDAAKEPARRALAAAINVAAGAVCGVTAWIFASEAVRMAEQGVETIGAFIIPKWWLAALLVYGFGNCALHFLRNAAEPSAAPAGSEP